MFYGLIYVNPEDQSGLLIGEIYHNKEEALKKLESVGGLGHILVSKYLYGKTLGKEQELVWEVKENGNRHLIIIEDGKRVGP